MTRLSRTKINDIIRHLPSRRVITVEWLRAQGVSPKLSWWYVHSGWLERIGGKAYKKAGEQVTWIGAVSALQEQLHLPVHVGGKTALQLLGQAHYIVMQDIQEVALFTPPFVSIPRWLFQETWAVEFCIQKTALFGKIIDAISLIGRTIDGIELQISVPERAIMELLERVPRHQSFDEAVLIMENLGYLRPSIVQSLLENCSSIKVKRLFLHLAERSRHDWLSEVTLDKVTLGQGKRMIGEGGHYDSKYQLSVPKLKDEEDVISDLP